MKKLKPRNVVIFAAVLVLCFGLVFAYVKSQNKDETAKTDEETTEETTETDEDAETEQETEVDSEEETEEDVSDFRRLDEKFMEPDVNYVWKNVKRDMEQDSRDLHRIVVDYDMVKNARPGDVVYDGYYFGDNTDPKDHIVISVPKVLNEGRLTGAMSGYGLLEVFSYVETEGQYSGWRADADLIIYDKDALKAGRVLTFVYGPLGNFTGGLALTTSVPTLVYNFESTEYGEEGVLSTAKFDARYGSAYFAGNSWDAGIYRGTTTFTENTIDLGADEYQGMVKRADQCNLLTRGTSDDYFNQDGHVISANDETTRFPNFSMEEFCNEISGPIAGAYRMEHGYNGYAFFYPRNRTAQVIAVKENTIYIALSARDFALSDQDPDVERDKIFIGTYYVDETEDPDMIQMNGDYFLTITRGTLDQLLYLLQDANIYWPTMNCGNLRLEKTNMSAPKADESKNVPSVPAAKVDANTQIIDATKQNKSTSQRTEYKESDYFDENPREVEMEPIGDYFDEITVGKAFVRNKLTTPLPDHVWKTVKQDLAQDADENLVITKEQLDAAEPGSILAIKKLVDKTITISVPEIRANGEKTDALDKYGVIEVFELEAKDTDDIDTATRVEAGAEIYLYDKYLLTDASPLILYGEDCRVVTSPLPYPPHISLYSDEFSIGQGQIPHVSRVFGRGQFGYGYGGPAAEDENVTFTNNCVDFGGEMFPEIVEWAQECNLENRTKLSELWGNGKTSYDLLKAFDFETGKFAAQLCLTEVDPELYYITANHIPTSVIVLTPTSISVAVTGSIALNLEEDKLWIGEYYVDNSGDTDMVGITGTDFKMSRNTLNALISLLDENGVNWWTLGLSYKAMGR